MPNAHVTPPCWDMSSIFSRIYFEYVILKVKIDLNWPMLLQNLKIEAHHHKRKVFDNLFVLGFSFNKNFNEIFYKCLFPYTFFKYLQLFDEN